MKKSQPGKRLKEKVLREKFLRAMVLGVKVLRKVLLEKGRQVLFSCT